jgi:hypothetical protein
VSGAPFCEIFELSVSDVAGGLEVSRFWTTWYKSASININAGTTQIDEEAAEARKSCAIARGCGAMQDGAPT